MDYARFNYVAQPGDDTCFIPKVGPYDRWAIEWGYRWFPQTMHPDEAQETLREWIAERGDDPIYRFGDRSATDPGSTSEALSNDPVRASELGIANLKKILPSLVDWTFQEGENYDQLEELYAELLQQWREYVRHVTLLVGGVDWTRRVQGQEGLPYTPVPRHRQRSAMAYLGLHVFQTPKWMIEPNVLYRVQGSGIQDRIRVFQVDALERLLSVARMKRLIEQEVLEGFEAYGLQEMLGDLRRSVWSELDDLTPIDPFRRDLQRGYLDRAQTLLEDEAALASDIAPLMRGEVNAVKGAAEASLVGVADELTRLHLQDVVARVDEILNPSD